MWQRLGKRYDGMNHGDTEARRGRGDAETRGKGAGEGKWESQKSGKRGSEGARGNRAGKEKP